MKFWDAEYQMNWHAAPPPEAHDSKQEGQTTIVTYRQNWGETQKFTGIKAIGGKVVAVDSWEQ